MNRKLSILTLMVLMTLVIGASGATAHGTVAPAGPSSPAAALGTEFTYQGVLTDGDSPASGTFDFEFGLYDDPDFGEGTLLGTVIVGDKPVTDGFFTVELDFGGVFDGTALYLEVGVRAGSSSGAYTTLSPRQALTPTPNAIYAMNAPWSGLNDIPAGFADGTDDTNTYTAGEGLALNDSQFSAQGSPYGNVVVVAKSGGDYTSIQAAVDSIPDAAANNPYLVWVAPGVYTETVTMQEWVDIEGAGELVTKITYTGSESFNTGTVVGADNAELRFLTVENTGGEDISIAIYNNNQSPRLTHVTATASGGTYSYGVDNYSSSPQMTDVTASASGGTNSYGVYNNSSSPQMNDVTATASGGNDSYGVYNNTSSPTINNSVIEASGGTNNHGIYNFAPGDSYIVTVNNSQITGSTATILSDAEFTTYVGASLLDGGDVVPNSGTMTCVGAYNESYTELTSICE